MKQQKDIEEDFLLRMKPEDEVRFYLWIRRIVAK